MSIPAPRQIQFSVFVQGVNSGTIWSDAASGSQIDFDTFARLATTAERGLFTAFFLGEGLRLREHLGRIHEADIAGRPDAQTQLAALAAITERIGLVATQNTTYNDPADLAYRLATLDLLSGGRAAWNIVTTDNAWTGENFRRGGWLDHTDRYHRAAEFVETTQRLWSHWPAGRIAATGDAPSWLETDALDPIGVDARHTRLKTDRMLPPSPQGRPVLFQAGDSDEGREFAARHAEVLFSRHHRLDDAVAFAADIRGRLARIGRSRDEVLFFPSQAIVTAATDAEAAEKAEWVYRSQISARTAISYLEQFWQTDLSAYDPDGPLPDIDPVSDVTSATRGVALADRRSTELSARWRAEAAAKGLSIRQFVIDTVARRGLVGSYATVADEIGRIAASGGVDGLNISPYLVPSGLDDIVDHVVPELQERGLYRHSYPGETLRENLGLPAIDADRVHASEVA